MTEIEDIYISGYSNDSNGGTSFVSIAMPDDLISDEDKRQLIQDLTQWMAQWIDGRQSPDYQHRYPEANARKNWKTLE